MLKTAENMYKSVESWNFRYGELQSRQEVVLLNAGFKNPQRNWIAQNCIMPFWVLWYNFERGNACQLRDKRIQLGPEKILLIPPNTFYSGEFETEVPHFYVWFKTDGCFSSPGHEALELPAEPFRRRVEEALVSGNRQIFTLYTLVSELLCSIPREFFSLQSVSTRTVNIEKALHFISQHDGDVTNEQIAAHLHLSRTRLLHLFKESVGISPQKYCAQIKMLFAEQLLKAGKSIQTVADACGYADRYHFSKDFKRFHQVPPGKWQREYLAILSDSQK